MKIIRNGDQEAVSGPAENFTGEVRIDAQFAGDDPSRVTGAIVSFAPGARTNWHTHPVGQTLIVTAGVGWTQCDGEDRVEIRAGDIIWCPPGHKHWHGAAKDTAMTHIAVQEAENGSPVTWLEPVTDEQYLGGTLKRG